MDSLQITNTNHNIGTVVKLKNELVQNEGFLSNSWAFELSPPLWDHIVYPSDIVTGLYSMFVLKIFGCSRSSQLSLPIGFQLITAKHYNAIANSPHNEQLIQQPSTVRPLGFSKRIYFSPQPQHFSLMLNIRFFIYRHHSQVCK